MPESITHTLMPVPSAPTATVSGACTLAMPYGAVCAYA